MELNIEELRKKVERFDFRTLKEVEEFCKSIYDEMEKLRLNFEKDTISDKTLIEHFKNDNPKDRFTSISVAGCILGGIELRNLWRTNGKLDGEKEGFPYNSKQIEMIDRYHNLEDILDEVEWYVESTVFEDEEEME